jgi:hypothetical protein
LLFLLSDPVNCGYRLDVVVENLVLLELKAIDAFFPIRLTPEHPKPPDLPTSLFQSNPILFTPAKNKGIREQGPPRA